MLILRITKTVTSLLIGCIVMITGDPPIESSDSDIANESDGDSKRKGIRFH